MVRSSEKYLKVMHMLSYMTWSMICFWHFGSSEKEFLIQNEVLIQNDTSSGLNSPNCNIIDIFSKQEKTFEQNNALPAHDKRSLLLYLNEDAFLDEENETLHIVKVERTKGSTHPFSLIIKNTTPELLDHLETIFKPLIREMNIGKQGCVSYCKRRGQWMQGHKDISRRGNGG